MLQAALHLTAVRVIYMYTYMCLTHMWRYRTELYIDTHEIRVQNFNCEYNVSEFAHVWLWVCTYPSPLHHLTLISLMGFVYISFDLTQLKVHIMILGVCHQ